MNKEERFAEIFGISKEDVEMIMNAVREYSLIENSESYSDWCKMYDGIHREGTFEQNSRNWLACYRWMKRKNLLTSSPSTQETDTTKIS